MLKIKNLLFGLLLCALITNILSDESDYSDESVEELDEEDYEKGELPQTATNEDDDDEDYYDGDEYDEYEEDNKRAKRRTVLNRRIGALTTRLNGSPEPKPKVENPELGHKYASVMNAKRKVCPQ